MTKDKEISLENLPKPWTRKQFMFAMGVVGGLSQKEAAIKAGFSEKTAHVHATKMLKEPNFSHIPEFINSKQNKTVRKWEYNHEKHIEQLVKQATFNIMDFYEPDPETGELKIDWRKVPYELGTVIDAVNTKQLSIKTVEGGEEISLPVLDTYVKFTDRTKAQDMLNKIMASYKESVDLNVKGEITTKFGSAEEAARAYSDLLKKR